jgi:hypothetical protein
MRGEGPRLVAEAGAWEGAGDRGDLECGRVGRGRATGGGVHVKGGKPLVIGT